MSLQDKISVDISAINPITKEYNYGFVTLPAISFEIENAFQKARVLKGGEYFIEIISCPKLPDLCDIRIDGHVEIKEMNLLAVQLQNLSECEIKALGGLIKSKVPDVEEDTLSIEELINMTYNLKDVRVIDGIDNLSELGAYAIENGLAEMYGLTKESLKYADLKAVGMKQKELDDGQFYYGSYIVTTGYETPKVYQTPPKEQLEVKNDYAFALKIAEAPVNDSSETEHSAEWMCLPIDKAEANNIAKDHNEGCIEDCVYYKFISAFPSIDEEVFDDMLKFDTLNEIAERYVKLDAANRIKFKAVVEKVEPRTLDEVLEISDNLSRYEHSYYSASEGDFAMEYLARQLPTNFDMNAFEKQEMRNFGERLVIGMEADVTDYGVVSAKDQSLYETITITANEQTEENQEEFEEQEEGIGGMTM